MNDVRKEIERELSVRFERAVRLLKEGSDFEAGGLEREAGFRAGLRDALAIVGRDRAEKADDPAVEEALDFVREGIDEIDRRIERESIAENVETIAAELLESGDEPPTFSVGDRVRVRHDPFEDRISSLRGITGVVSDVSRPRESTVDYTSDIGSSYRIQNVDLLTVTD